MWSLLTLSGSFPCPEMQSTNLWSLALTQPSGYSNFSPDWASPSEFGPHRDRFIGELRDSIRDLEQKILDLERDNAFWRGEAADWRDKYERTRE